MFFVRFRQVLAVTRLFLFRIGGFVRIIVRATVFLRYLFCSPLCLLRFPGASFLLVAFYLLVSAGLLIPNSSYR